VKGKGDGVCMVLPFRDQLSLCLGQYGFELRIPLETSRARIGAASSGSSLPSALRVPDIDQLKELYHIYSQPLPDDVYTTMMSHGIVCLNTPYGRAVPLSFRTDGTTVVSLPFGRAILSGTFKVSHQLITCVNFSDPLFCCEYRPILKYCVATRVIMVMMMTVMKTWIHMMLNFEPGCHRLPNYHGHVLHVHYSILHLLVHVGHVVLLHQLLLQFHHHHHRHQEVVDQV
jgi:hypothetical protein